MKSFKAYIGQSVNEGSDLESQPCVAVLIEISDSEMFSVQEYTIQELENEISHEQESEKRSILVNLLEQLSDFLNENG